MSTRTNRSETAKDGMVSPKGFVQLARRSGPAFLASGLNIGSASVTNSVLLAAATGFVFGWVFIPAVLAIYVATIICVRITLVTKRDPIDAIRAYVHPAAAIVNGVAILVVNFVFHLTNVALAGLALNLLIPQVSTPVWTVAAIVMTAILALVPGQIKVLNNILKYLIIVLVAAYVVALFIIPINWGAAAQMFTFTLPSTQSDVLVFTAVLGAALAINVPVVQAYASREAGYGTSTFGLARFETLATNILLLVVQFAVLLVVASTLFAEGVEATTAIEAASALEPVAGPLAPVLFGVGLFGACITTLAAQTQVSGYVVSDLLGWKREIGSKRFKIVQATMLVLALSVPILGFDPFDWAVWGAAFNATFMPIGIVTWWYLANKSKIMGRFRANAVMNLLIGVAMVIATVAAVRFWFVTLAG